MNHKKLLVVLTLALTSGGLASYLSLGYLSRPAAAAPASNPATGIVVAARALSPGTTIQTADVRLVPWSTQAPPAGLSTRVEDVVGRVVSVSLGVNEPIASNALAAEGSGSGLPGLIPAGKRAISVSVDEVVGVNGFVGPGARVDVIATLEAAAGSGDAVSRLVLQDVEVLASGHQLQADPNGAPQQAPVVTFLVTPEQAEQLVLATHKGRIQLALRSRADRGEVATAGVRTSALTGAAPPAPHPTAPSVRPERASTRPLATPARHTPTEERVVEVFNGKERTVVKY